MELINYSKPKSITIVCPRCGTSNSFKILMLGDIVGRRLICSGCSKTFKAYVHWKPDVWTEKEIYDDDE